MSAQSAGKRLSMTAKERNALRPGLADCRRPWSSNAAVARILAPHNRQPIAASHLRACRQPSSTNQARQDCRTTLICKKKAIITITEGQFALSLSQFDQKPGICHQTSCSRSPAKTVAPRGSPAAECTGSLAGAVQRGVRRCARHGEPSPIVPSEPSSRHHGRGDGGGR